MGVTRSAARHARALVIAAVTGGIVLSAVFASADAPEPCLRVIAPADGSRIPPGNVLVIGTAKGEGISRVEVDVNGKGRKVVDAAGGGFSVNVPLPAGRNIIRVTSGKVSVSIGVTGEAKGPYRYHDGVEKCEACHDRKGNGFTVGENLETLCYRCHDRQDGGKHLHGPLGGGECTACHDPHGSMSAALTVGRVDTLCVTCHDQESSADHMRRSRGKECTECHNPHSSDNPFLRR